MPLSLDEVAAVSGETPAAASTLVNELVWESDIIMCMYRGKTERERKRAIEGDRGRDRDSTLVNELVWESEIHPDDYL
jgi:hypothetical protein